ncbi:MAG: hypothetical protein OXG15_06130 [Gammaproteobacteria bacterium]|nr:hypothetical protein [Gammaproteobacteria bacterium]
MKRLDKAIRALLRMPAPPHVRPPTPTKADLERKFVMRVDRSGRPRIEEV